MPVGRIRPIVIRAIMERNNPSILGSNGSFNQSKLGGLRRAANEISLATGKDVRSVERMLSRILSGGTDYSPKVRQKHPLGPATSSQKKRLSEAGVGFDEDITAKEAHSILVHRVKRIPYNDVDFYTVDEILTGLGLVHLWYTELEDLYCVDLGEAAV